MFYGQQFSSLPAFGTDSVSKTGGIGSGRAGAFAGTVKNIGLSAQP